MVNGLHLYSTFLTSGLSKRLTILPNIHAKRQPARREKVRVLLRDTSTLTLGGAGDRTSNLPVTSQPALYLPSHPCMYNLWVVTVKVFRNLGLVSAGVLCGVQRYQRDSAL